MVSKQAQRQERGQELDEIVRQLSQQSLGEWTSFMEESGKDKGCLIEDLYYHFTSGPPHSLHLEVCRLLKSCLTQYLSCDGVHCHPPGSTENGES